MNNVKIGGYDMNKLKVNSLKKWLLLLILGLLLLNSKAWAQDRGISYAVGFGLVGVENMKGFGPYVSAFLPINENSELKTDLSYNSMPSELAGYDNLKITCLETDYRYIYEPGSGFMQVGLGINVNMVNGGYSDQVISGSNKHEPFNNAIGLGMGLNIGIGFYITTKFAIYGEYAAQGIFGKAETGWGGIKLGLRYFPKRE